MRADVLHPGAETTHLYTAAMKSRHQGWQAYWDLDRVAGRAVHDCGLRIRLVDGVGLADNADEVAESFVPQHGSHNAAAMVQRLVREGTQLLIDPDARGWRSSEGKAG